MSPPMPELEPRDANFAGRVHDSFARQPFMDTIGARITHLAAGEVDITMPNTPEVAQQHNYIHGGVLTAIADSAAGYAALSIAAPGTGVLTTELKVNFLRTAEASAVVARGRVVKPGRTLTIVRCDLFGIRAHPETQLSEETHLLTGLVTMMHVDGLAD